MELPLSNLCYILLSETVMFREMELAGSCGMRMEEIMVLLVSKGDINSGLAKASDAHFRHNLSNILRHLY